MNKVRVLFVCLGNICRSPVAEGIFFHLVKERGLSDKIKVDSAGTSAYHLGELADPRMRQTAKKYGIELTHRARQFLKDDFSNFDYIIAMDHSNRTNILSLIDTGDESHQEKVVLMRAYDPEPEDGQVPDPYFGGQSGFDQVYQTLLRSNNAFLDYLITKHHL